MSNKYLTFISDEDLFECIGFLYKKYKNTSENMNLEKFYKNKLDPIKFSFDIEFKGISQKQKIIEEIYRQQDKTISNHIGKFHELLISKINGFKLSDGGHDIENKQCTVFAEIKNKHNTIKGEDKKNIHKKMVDIAEKNPEAICYVVHVIGKSSYNRVWEFTSGKGINKKIHKHSRVREITADEFYKLATGMDNAFYNLCKIIPVAINDYIKLNNINISEVNNSDLKLYEKIDRKSSEKGIEVIDEIFEDTFSDYLGFRKKTYTAVDLFAGAGGLALGLEKSGFEIVGALDIDSTSCKTLKSNRPEWNVIQDDIANIAEEGIKRYIDKEIDLLTGCLPCQAFSYIGEKIELEYLKGTMFYHYTKIVEQLSPKVFLIENVKGLVYHDQGKTLDTMVKLLSNIGYEVKYEVLNALDYGVAQKRERLIIIGTRKNLPHTDFKFPKPLGYKLTLRDTLEGVKESNGINFTEKEESLFKLLPPGGRIKDLPKDILKEYTDKGYLKLKIQSGIGRRMCWDESCSAITSLQIRMLCHPEYIRPFTIREYARIQSFPDEWKFKGSINQVYKQISNALPVNLGKEIGLSVVDYLNKIKTIKCMK